MKYLPVVLLLIMPITYGADTECKPNSFGDLPAVCEKEETPEDWGAIPAGTIYNGISSFWELTLVDVDGKFIDLDYGDRPLLTRNECMRQGIYRMEQSLDNQHKALRTDRGAVATYTQYLGFICEEEQVAAPDSPEEKVQE